jgi:hypothetical protein
VGERYGLALLIVGLIYLVGAVPAQHVPVVTNIMFIGVLLLVVQQGSVPRTARTAAYVAAAVSAVGIIPRLINENPVTIGIDALSTLIVIIIAFAAVITRILQHGTVTLTTVFGAVLCYALLAFGYASLFEIVQALTGQPFFAQGAQPEPDFVYFSIITLTTVGFGDLTPAGELARRVVAVEAFTGQVFLVVLVARLVSLWQPPSRLLQRPGAEQEPG